MITDDRQHDEMSTTLLHPTAVRSRARGVVEDEQVGRAVGQRAREHVLRREREERDLQLLGRQGRWGDGCDDGLLDKCGRREERRHEAGDHRVREGVDVGQRGHGEDLLLHGLRNEVGRH